MKTAQSTTMGLHDINTRRLDSAPERPLDASHPPSDSGPWVSGSNLRIIFPASSLAVLRNAHRDLAGPVGPEREPFPDLRFFPIVLCHLRVRDQVRASATLT